MRRLRWAALLILAVVITGGAAWLFRSAAGEKDPGPVMVRFLQSRASQLQLGRTGEENREASRMTREFYERRADRPAWTSARKPSRRGREAVEALAQAVNDGLDPADYGAAELRKRLARKFESDDDRLAFDAELTQALLLLAHHMIRGRFDPRAAEMPWQTSPGKIDPVERIVAASREGRVRDAIASFRPSHAGYEALRGQLVRYRALASAGGWTNVPPGPSLPAGDEADPARIAALRSRLQKEGFLAERGRAQGASPARFDAELAGAVASFQSLRGIVPDSILGPETVDALNVSANARVAQIELNLERHRWIPDRNDARAIEVNIPSFELWARENGRTVLHMPVIVGQPSWESPIFSDRMDHLVLNPYWNVPESIAADEILPAIAKDPGYVEKHDLEVVAADGETVVPIRKVDWREFDHGYRFRQRPGPRNALGRIKFMFPNQFNVYLHDTPTQPLFEETDRAFSHGCIRVAQPLELAEWVMGGRWSRERFAEEIATGEQRTVSLPEPVPVHILYRTAFVDDAGLLQFHQDIYGVDAALANAFARRRAAPASASR